MLTAPNVHLLGLDADIRWINTFWRPSPGLVKYMC